MAIELAEGFVTIRARIDPGIQGQIQASVARQVSGAERSLARFDSAAQRTTHGMGQLQRGAFAASLSVAGLRGAVLAAGSSFLVGAGLIRGIELFLGLSAEFERSMNQFQAVSHASAAAMRDASDAAIQLGRDITLPSTSASDAATAMTELARGGLSVKDSMDAARGSLQLAAAAGTDFATAAQIQARALQAFGLAGDQAVRVADALANAANVSTGDITDMAFALRQSAAVANQVGLSLEDTATAISLLANAGITGSDAGTSLRTMLLRLIPATTKAKEELARLGVDTTDASGNFLPFAAILDQFRDALAKLGPAQRQFALQTIFGQDAIRAATILTASGARGFENMERAIRRSGAAAQLAAARNRGLAGTFDALRSNFESIAINVGRQALPALTNFVRGLNSQLTALSESKDAANALQTAVEGLRGGFAVVAGIVQTIGPPVLALTQAFIRLADAIGGAPIIGAIAVYKAMGLALNAVASVQNRVNTAVGGFRAVMAGTSEVTRGGTLALTEYGQAQARVVAAAQATAAANAKANASTVTRAASTVSFVGVLTGQAAAEEAVKNEALKLALASGRVTQAEIQEAAAAEAAAQAWERQNAARRAGATVAVVPAGVPGAGQFTSIQSAQASEKAARALADTRRQALAASLGVASLGQRFSALGSSVLGFVGGPWGALTLAITAGITLWTIFGQRGETALERVKKDTDALNDSMLDQISIQDQLVGARAGRRSARIAVDEANLNKQIALGTLLTAQASGSARDIAAARIGYRRATEQAREADENYRRSIRETLELQDKARAAEQEAGAARKKVVQDQVSAFASFFQAARRSVQFPEFATGDFLDKEVERRRILIRQAQLSARAIEQEADSRRKNNPLLAHQLDLLAELVRKVQRAPKTTEVSVILNVKTLRGGVDVPGVGTIGGGPTDPFTLVEGARTATHRAAEATKPRFVDEGKNLGAALMRGMAQAIRDGEQEIQDAIISAKSNLIGIGQSLTGLFDQAIDTGPLAARIKTLQEQLDRVRREDERRRLQEDLRDARRNLARAREQIDPLGGGGLTAAQAARRRQQTQDFLQPLQRQVRDATRGIREFNTEQLIANLQKVLQAQKDAVHKGIQDIIAGFVSGRIPAGRAVRQIAAYVHRFAPDFRKAGNVLGTAFTDEFQATLDSLNRQIQLLAAPAVRRRGGGFPGPEVQDPTDAIRRARQEVLQRQKELTDKLTVNSTAVRANTRAINRWLDSGVVPTIPPPRRNRRGPQRAGGGADRG